jgi:hypothetical protein
MTMGHVADPGEAPTAAEVARAARAINAEPAVRRQRAAAMLAWREAQVRGAASAAGSGRASHRRPPRSPFTGRSVARSVLGHALHPWRQSARVALAGLAVLLVTAGTVTAASQPGAPLYSTRLAVERAALPTVGTRDRVDADVAYADRRLVEAGDAVARHDDRAAVAALDAFDDAVRRLEADAPRDARTVLWPLRQHLRVLAAAIGTSAVEVREALATAGGDLPWTGRRVAIYETRARWRAQDAHSRDR